MKRLFIFFVLVQISMICCLTPEEYFAELQKINFKDVKEDLKALLTKSQDWWPADYGHYGPLMIRLAWHCAGSYRGSDGRGGCDGGRQRFDPERSWDDNTNLDKARKLLWPIKEKYGNGLSWGDLFILAGNAAIESMGAPVLGFCAGRVDEDDANESLLLGPTPEQEALIKCQINGQCPTPFGATTINLIYVNPEGPMGRPIPERSRFEVRDTFGRMGMNDTETVALIGGGHSFGKAHGACPAGAGKKPKEDPANPWPGNCGSGKGVDSFTSGFEGPWTTNPIQFDNGFFKNLLNYDWDVYKGPGGHHQWGISGYGQKPQAPTADGKGKQDLMMLTTDISLLKDESYLRIVKDFSLDQKYFADQFSHAWYKLTTRDMGPYERCYGNDLPPPQDFQYPLPPPSQEQPDWTEVRNAIKNAIYTRSDALEPDMLNGKPSYGAWFVHLAYQCASTYRRTDYLGGCNGARIRFSPQKNWRRNTGIDRVLHVLEPVKAIFGNKLSWADLIVLAGTVALEEATGQDYDFCPGRSDAIDGKGSESLRGIRYSDVLSQFRDQLKLSGLSAREYIALQGRIRSGEAQKKLGYHGSWYTGKFDNEYFKNLLNDLWIKVSDYEVKAYGLDVYMTAKDLVLTLDTSILSVLQEFSTDVDEFKRVFRQAWTKLMNIDRFDGPIHNKCNNPSKKNLKLLE